MHGGGGRRGVFGGNPCYSVDRGPVSLGLGVALRLFLGDPGYLR